MFWLAAVRGAFSNSDRGSTCTAIRFANRLTDDGIAQSMGSVGDSRDNALMENFFSTSKTELVYRKSWRTREDAENALFAYIDGWYNAQPVEKRLGWLSPDEYEARYHGRFQPEPDNSLSGSAREPHTGYARKTGPDLIGSGPASVGDYFLVTIGSGANTAPALLLRARNRFSRLVARKLRAMLSEIMINATTIRAEIVFWSAAPSC